MVNPFITVQHSGWFCIANRNYALYWFSSMQVYNLHFLQLSTAAVGFSCYAAWTLLKKFFSPGGNISSVYNAFHNLTELKSFPSAQGMCSGVVLKASRGSQNSEVSTSVLMDLLCLCSTLLIKGTRQAGLHKNLSSSLGKFLEATKLVGELQFSRSSKSLWIF